MADPRTIGGGQQLKDARRRVLSPLMEAKADNRTGGVVNFCPFGCEDDELDEHGYCDHLIGFTDDGKEYEPMVMNDKGKRLVMVRREVVGGRERPILEPVLQRTDKLVQITTSYRVYRKDAPRSVKPQD